MELLNSMEASGIQCRHKAQPQDNNRLKVIDLACQLAQFFRSSKQQWPLHMKHADVGGNMVVLDDMSLGFFQAFCG